MKYSVVIAEDETLLQRSLIKKISQTDPDFEIVGAAQTGSQALELVRQHAPFLLITDIRMPVMNGLELIERAREYQPDLDCVILSGYSDFVYAQTAIHLRVQEYLLKPVDAEKLREVLASLKKRYQLKKKELASVFSSSAGSPRQIADLLRDYLCQNFTQDINLNLIAENLSYSPGYLTKIFSQYFDMTPNKYLITLRMQRARHLLASAGELSIRQIGEAVGYPEQGYFSRIFKKYVGVNPQKYRDDQPSG